MTLRAVLVALASALFFLIGFEILRSLPLDVDIKFVLWLGLIGITFYAAGRWAVPARKKHSSK